MKFLSIIILCFCLFINCTKEKLGTKLKITNTTKLDSTINECSGITVYDNKLFTINDSGDSNLIYEIKESGTISKTHVIANSLNNDWECLESDTDYLYIGDIGNNFGDRKNLIVFQLNNDLSINKEFKIEYRDQLNFANRLKHNFDAEAMVINEGKLWIFTKNYENDSTNVYHKNLIQDTELYKLTSLPTNGLVTDAYYDTIKDKLYLLMYKITTSEFTCYLNIYGGLGSNQLKVISSYLLPITEQAEAITRIDEYDFLIGTEKEGTNEGGNLYKIRIEE